MMTIRWNSPGILSRWKVTVSSSPSPSPVWLSPECLTDPSPGWPCSGFTRLSHPAHSTTGSLSWKRTATTSRSLPAFLKTFPSRPRFPRDDASQETPTDTVPVMSSFWPTPSTGTPAGASCASDRVSLVMSAITWSSRPGTRSGCRRCPAPCPGRPPGCRCCRCRTRWIRNRRSFHFRSGIRASRSSLSSAYSAVFPLLPRPVYPHQHVCRKPVLAICITECSHVSRHSVNDEPRVTRAGQRRYDAYHDPRVPGTRKGENVNEKQPWTGIAPSPTVLGQLDYEEMAVLALLSWSTATNRPVTSLDVANLEDRDGKKLGPAEAKDIVLQLGDLKIASVDGMGNDRPMSVRLGGLVPRMPRKFDDRRPAPQRTSSSAAPRSAPAAARRPESRSNTTQGT